MKKVFGLLLCIIALFAITGCGKEEKTKKDLEQIVLADETLHYETIFTYEKGKNYSDIEEDDSGKYGEISFKNEDLDLSFEMYYTESRTTTYNETKEARSKQKYFKEYKFGEFDAYAYGESDSNLKLSIFLEEELDTGLARSIFVSIDRLDVNEDVIVADVVADKEVQSLLNSIELKRIN